MGMCVCACMYVEERVSKSVPSQMACIKLGTTRTHPICAHRGRNRCFRTVISNGVTKRSLNRLWFLNFASKLKVTQCVFVRNHRTQRSVHKCWNIYWTGFMQRVPDRHLPPRTNSWWNYYFCVVSFLHLNRIFIILLLLKRNFVPHRTDDCIVNLIKYPFMVANFNSYVWPCDVAASRFRPSCQ